MIFVVAQKQGPHGALVVVTDKEILGKKFEEGKTQLDLTQKFYQGEEQTKEQIVGLCKSARHLHLTGKASVALGIELDLVDAAKILYVQGIPHAEVFIEQ